MIALRDAILDYRPGLGPRVWMLTWTCSDGLLHEQRVETSGRAPSILDLAQATMRALGWAPGKRWDGASGEVRCFRPGCHEPFGAFVLRGDEIAEVRASGPGSVAIDLD